MTIKTTLNDALNRGHQASVSYVNKKLYYYYIYYIYFLVLHCVFFFARVHFILKHIYTINQNSNSPT